MGQKRKKKRGKPDSALKEDLIFMAKIPLVRQESISTIIQDIGKATLEYCVQFWKNMIERDEFESSNCKVSLLSLLENLLQIIKKKIIKVLDSITFAKQRLGRNMVVPFKYMRKNKRRKQTFNLKG